jgi:hypothetical protein
LIKTTPVGKDTTANIKGTLGTVSATGVLAITAPKITTLALAPSSVAGGKSSIGTVRISSAAPTGGLVISLKSSLSSATLGQSVTILAGKTSATFPISTVKGTAKVTSTITAGLNGLNKTALLTILK